jgi:hypothetical protein
VRPDLGGYHRHPDVSVIPEITEEQSCSRRRHGAWLGMTRPSPARRLQTLFAMKLSIVAVATAIALASPPAPAQAPNPNHQTIEGVMTELYASVTRKPGEPFAWDRLRAIMLPGAIMLPQRRQTQGESRMMRVDDFITWIDAGWRNVIGTANDRGFYERQTNLVVDQYGDVANAFTTYEKGPYEPRQVQGRCINAVQLVRRDGRWFIVSITWDEENSAGPLSEKYRGK